MDPLTLDEVELRAKARLPKHIYEFYASGSDDQQALSHNRSAFRRLFIRPRVLRDVSRVDTTTNLFGWRSPVPFGITPSAMQKLAGGDGESDTAKAAANLGINMTLSSQSTVSLEHVMQVRQAGSCEPVSPPLWMQIYLYEDMEKSIGLIRRAEAAGYQALCLTVDTPVLGNRLSERKTPVVLPQGMVLENLDQQLASGHSSLPSVNRRLMNAKSAQEARVLLAKFGRTVHSSSLTWERTIAFLRQTTKMKVILKGIMTAEDAALAVEHGVDAILVSNHGGRQLDATCSTIEALPAIVATVKSAIPIIMDGGIHSGADVFKAIALGASFVHIGRPALWGLAYNGHEGVETVLNNLERELSRTMALAGVTRISDISPECLGVRSSNGFGMARL